MVVPEPAIRVVKQPGLSICTILNFFAGGKGPEEEGHSDEDGRPLFQVFCVAPVVDGLKEMYVSIYW